VRDAWEPRNSNEPLPPECRVKLAEDLWSDNDLAIGHPAMDLRHQLVVGESEWRLEVGRRDVREANTTRGDLAHQHADFTHAERAIAVVEDFKHGASMRGAHRTLLATLGELFLIGAPAFEMALDHFAFGACATQRQPCSICMTFALEVGDFAAHFFGERIGKLFAATRDEAIGLRELRARRSRRKQRIAGDNGCAHGVASGLGSSFCPVEPFLRNACVTDGRRKLTNARSFGACPHISHGSKPVVGHTAMLH